VVNNRFFAKNLSLCLFCGFSLAVISQIISGYFLAYLMHYGIFKYYWLIGLSTALPALLIAVPLGYLYCKKNLSSACVFGLFIGFIASFFLCLTTFFYSVNFSTGFIAEMVFLILFTGISCGVGRLIKMTQSSYFTRSGNTRK